jgi:hypothetical protein
MGVQLLPALGAGAYLSHSADADGDADGHGNANANRDRNGDGHDNGYAHRDGYGNGHTDRDGNGGAHTGRNANGNGYTDAHGDAHCDLADGNDHSNTNRHAGAVSFVLARHCTRTVDPAPERITRRFRCVTRQPPS